MKKFIAAAMLSLASLTSSSYAQNIDVMKSTAKTMLRSLGGHGIAPVGLKSDDVNALFNASNEYSSDNIFIPKDSSFYKFNEHFISDNALEVLPADNDSLEGKIFFAFSNNAATFLNLSGYKVNYGEKTLIVDIANKNNPDAKYVFSFVVDNVAAMSSFSFEQSYLPSTTWPDSISFTDSDNDGLLDVYEKHFFGSLAQSATGDFDGDGISNRDELHNGANPAQNDRFAGKHVKANWHLSSGGLIATEGVKEDIILYAFNLFQSALKMYENSFVKPALVHEQKLALNYIDSLVTKIIDFHESVTDVNYNSNRPNIQFKSLPYSTAAKYNGKENIVFVNDRFALTDCFSLLEDISTNNLSLDEKRLRESLSHELAHFLTDSYIANKMPHSWLAEYVNQSSGRTIHDVDGLDAGIIIEGIGEYFGKLFSTGVSYFPENRWNESFSNVDFSNRTWKDWLFYGGGYDIVKPILKGNEHKGLLWLLENELKLLPPIMDPVVAYKRKGEHLE